jgi:hypothetical protein
MLLPKLNSSLLNENHKMIIIFGPHSEYNKAQVGALFVVVSVYERLTLDREIVSALITVPTESRQTARFRDRMFLLTQWRSSDVRPRPRHIHRINTACRCIRLADGMPTRRIHSILVSDAGNAVSIVVSTCVYKN